MWSTTDRWRWHSNELDGSLLIVFFRCCCCCCCFCCAFAILMAIDRIEQVNDRIEWHLHIIISDQCRFILHWTSIQEYIQRVCVVEWTIFFFSFIFFVLSSDKRYKMSLSFYINVIECGGIIFNGHRFWSIWKIIFQASAQQNVCLSEFQIRLDTGYCHINMMTSTSTRTHHPSIVFLISSSFLFRIHIVLYVQNSYECCLTNFGLYMYKSVAYTRT